MYAEDGWGGGVTLSSSSTSSSICGTESQQESGEGAEPERGRTSLPVSVCKQRGGQSVSGTSVQLGVARVRTFTLSSILDRRLKEQGEDGVQQPSTPWARFQLVPLIGELLPKQTQTPSRALSPPTPTNSRCCVRSSFAGRQ